MVVVTEKSKKSRKIAAMAARMDKWTNNSERIQRITELLQWIERVSGMRKTIDQMWTSETNIFR